MLRLFDIVQCVRNLAFGWRSNRNRVREWFRMAAGYRFSLPFRRPSSLPAALTLTVGLLHAFVAQFALASSCRPWPDRYFVSCRDGTCAAELHVTYTGAVGGCERRSRVLEVDDDIGKFIVPIVEAASPPPQGLYELRFRNPYWFKGENVSFAALLRNLDQDNPNRADPDGASIALLSPTAARERLDRTYGNKWLTKVSGDSSAEGVAEQRVQLERIARNEHLLSVALLASRWGGSLVALILLIYSIHLFFLRLHAEHGKRWRSLLIPVGMQVAIGAACVSSIWLADDPWPGVVLIPALATVLLAQGLAVVLRRYASRRARSAPESSLDVAHRSRR